MRTLALSTVMLAVTACGSAEPAPGAPLDPLAFFSGKSHGEATLSQVFTADRHVSVDSVGYPQRDGTLILTQSVAVQGKPPKAREWLLRRDRPGHYSGTLTEATGPVEADQVADAVRIRYKMKGGLKVEQWLAPLPGGKAIDNQLKVTKLGVKVAFLHEVIRKLD
ncbi:MAG: DUF3833 family protein [Sphingomicrobium sp.]